MHLVADLAVERAQPDLAERRLGEGQRQLGPWTSSPCVKRWGGTDIDEHEGHPLGPPLTGPLDCTPATCSSAMPAGTSHPQFQWVERARP